ncbi:MAG: hypothetical protein JO287_04360 [Pseudonocardiales bacterium]|nr:hypothetical protein [Pseudonocardiales bacterium]
MLSFRDAAKKKVSPHGTVDMAGLAQELNTGRPVSLMTLIRDLNNALPDFKTFDSGPLGPSTTTGWAQVGFTIDGGVMFRGSIHESGFFGHDYTFAMSVANYRDSSGNLVVFAHSGSIEGTDSARPWHEPKRDDSWPSAADSQEGNASLDSFVSENWDNIKSSPWHADLQVDTDVGEVVKGIVVTLMGAAAFAAGAFIVSLFLHGACAHSGTDPQTGQGTLVITPKQQDQPCPSQ